MSSYRFLVPLAATLDFLIQMAAAVAKLVFGTFVTGSSIASGAAVYHRNNLRAAKQKEADDSVAAAQVKLADSETRFAAQRDKFAAESREASGRAEIVASLWADRSARIVESEIVADSFIVALPEAMATGEGLHSHYAHMAQNMPAYKEMDVISSKIHTFGMLLAAAQQAPSAVRQLGGKFTFLFQGEPLASAIGGSMTDAAVSVDTPETLEQLSDVFVQTNKCLRGAVHEVNRRAAESASVAPPSGPRPGGPILDGLRGLARQLRFATSSREDEEAIEVARRAAAAKQFALDSSANVAVLRNADDIMAALVHIDSAAAAARETQANGARWADDREVQWALAGLGVWAVAAERFLADAQAVRALAAAHQCLQFSMVQVNADGA